MPSANVTLTQVKTGALSTFKTEPNGLYSAPSGEEAFAIKRTISRLIEMRSPAYLGTPHGARAAAPPLAPQPQSG